MLRIAPGRPGVQTVQLQGVHQALAVVIAVEGITEAIFRAGPLQPARNYLIGKTPWLFSESMGTHLLECKYCVSFWVALAGAQIVYFDVQNALLWIVIYTFSLQRIANWVHLLFSVIRDRQLDMRIARNRRD